MRHTLFGESHGPAIGVTLSGVPAGLALDMDFIQRDMARRAPGKSPLATARCEADAVRILSGVYQGYTTGSPLCGVIENTDTRSRDYSQIPRPGHADYAASVRYQGYNDHRGGGHFSGRLTAPLVFAGAVAKLILKQRGIESLAHIRSIGSVFDVEPDPVAPDRDALRAAASKELCVLDDARGEAMRAEVLAAKEARDSVGGSVRCLVCGLTAGYGGPDMDDTLEGMIARHVFAIPAVKGVEFGTGFALSAMRGSESNDQYLPCPGDGELRTSTNHNGGINGGISNGMPLIVSVGFKPTPSIGLPQASVDPATGQAVRLETTGRHDPCIVPRAVPVVEAAVALAVCEALGI